MRCSYCAKEVNDSDDFLECEQCQANVHVKCLHTCRPGDLLGDIFFDFTCADCMSLQHNLPSTSSYAKTVPVEKLIRQHLPWFMVVTLALYNLSIKSKGLSYYGYFHWRSHIVGFVNKNWDYLFEPGTKRRKNWLGSISGNLSHFSPDLFCSGQEEIKKPGWWKLTHHNCTPRDILKKYEEFSKQRAQQRNGKRKIDNNDIYDIIQETKRRRSIDSDDDVNVPVGGCSRTIPYMGRNPKTEKQLDIIEDDINKSLEQQQQEPFNTVQSSLMDFLAENLGNDDLNMFNNLPNMVSDPLVDSDDKDDFLPLLEPQTDNINLFDVPDLKCDFNLNQYEETTSEPIDSKEAIFDGEEQPTDSGNLSPMSSIQITPDDSLQTPSEYSNDAADDDQYQPRIIKVTNFQELNIGKDEDQLPYIPAHLDKAIKEEAESDIELSAGEEIKSVVKTEEQDTHSADYGSEMTRTNKLMPCKPSLFTKNPRRTLPWQVEEPMEGVDPLKSNEVNDSTNVRLMTESEEAELFEKFQQVFALEDKCKIEIPAYVRRFYRRLCVRDWKRRHHRPIFNLDDAVNGVRGYNNSESKTKIIDRFQLISQTTGSKRKPFSARIAGSCEYELFESPYTHRILKPFIYRNKVCIPPWVKLMCELQYKVNQVPPTRAPIDYCYVRPYHIAAVNALLQSSFWPDIDMTECLSYPDYSVVALYKKLVVGCGFLVPDVGFNEAYISFMAVRPNWQRCGIGTFMLYHLIQTCMSKDITLHVSATNPAVVLYQKFGFKIEEIILDFYEKYLPDNSKQSKTAFFLRLMR